MNTDDRSSDTDAGVLQNVHVKSLGREIAWFDEVLNTRLRLYFSNEADTGSIWDLSPPVPEDGSSAWQDFVRHYKCTPDERLILMLALLPHIQPQVLDVFFTRNGTYDKGFTEFGGLKGTTHGGFLPTGETALFLLAAKDLPARSRYIRLFDPAHYFMAHQVLQLNDSAADEPAMSGALVMNADFINYFLTGHQDPPRQSRDFPARRIETAMSWSDLVLPEDTLAQVREIEVWIRHHQTLMEDWGLGKKLRPGYKSLFYGPPGTGKTLVACLLGKLCQREVYRIDLSIVVSKYIGETEKNLEKIFRAAESRDWILFFDEADALFGKRTGVSNSNDRYANQETAYLLQRIEDFPGLIILASNLKNNIDEAFSRRFQTLIYFPVPQEEERYRLWSSSFSPVSTMEQGFDLRQLARKYELTGGMIMNVIRYSSLKAIERNEKIIRMADVEKGIQKELTKEGRMM